MRETAVKFGRSPKTLRLFFIFILIQLRIIKFLYGFIILYIDTKEKSEPRKRDNKAAKKRNLDKYSTKGKRKRGREKIHNVPSHANLK